MMLRKELFKLIAARYGLGYAEIIRTNEICLIGSYLPNLEEKKEFRLNKLNSAALKNMNADDKLKKKLNIYYCERDFHEVPTHIYCHIDEHKFSKEEINEIISSLDKHLIPLEFKVETEHSNTLIPLPIFNYCQVGIRKPIRDNNVLYKKFTSAYFDENDSGYSLIFNFLTAEHLRLFLENISTDGINQFCFATYRCNYSTGCYQILVPENREYLGIQLLRSHRYLADLPIVHHLINSLRPMNLFEMANSGRSIPTDEQTSAALQIITKLFEKKSMLSLTDFDLPTAKLIEADSGLKIAFFSTIEYVKRLNKYKKVLDLSLDPLPKPLKNIVLDYDGISNKII